MINEWWYFFYHTKILKVYCWIFGHLWLRWSIPRDGDWVTTTAKSQRNCNRCFGKQYRKWTEEEQKQIDANMKTVGKAMLTGLIGELYGVRFIES